MPIDPSSLRKLETQGPAAQAEGIDDDRVMAVLVKLREGAQLPEFVNLRGKITDRLYSANVLGADLLRLEAEPGVESITVSRTVPVIE